MITRLISYNKDNNETISLAVKALDEGKVIGFPTETVYGIGADIFNENAVRSIFDIKIRNIANPLAAHISDLKQVEELCVHIPEEFYKLSARFLPGPLSVVLKKKSHISKLVTAGLDTLAIRFPDNAIILGIINNFGKPLAGTSANISGKLFPVTGPEALDNMDGKISIIIDGGETKYKIESTVISLAGDKPELLRLGAISKEEIEEVLGVYLLAKAK